MKKIVVGGSIGAGKSTLAKALSKKLHIEHTELDSFYWLPGWHIRPAEQTKELINKTTSVDRWIICGNFSAFKEFTVDRAVTIIWLDYPFVVCFWQALKRAIRNIKTQQKCCNGNQETWGRLFFSKDSILLWLIRTFRRRNRRYEKMMHDPLYKNKTLIRLQSHKEAEKWLESLAIKK
jgi:adenylate kinase family enzyme